MIAVDTNVLVRFLTADDPKQAARAKKLFERETIFIGVTVLLETEWVLRGAYGLASDAVGAAFAALSGLPRVTIERSAAVARALRWRDDGMDFADALHLAGAEGCESFATFDARLVRAGAAQREGSVDIRAV